MTLTDINAGKPKKRAEREEFELEPSQPGVVPMRVIDELRRCYREAKDYASALRDAIKTQAQKHGVASSALRQYVAALEGDDVADKRKEVDDLIRLMDHVE